MAAGAVGPVEAHLGMFGEMRPFVVGAFGEHSSGLHLLVKAMAVTGAEKHWRAMRCQTAKECRRALVAMIRRTLGLAAMQANAQLLQRWMQHVGGVRVVDDRGLGQREFQ